MIWMKVIIFVLNFLIGEVNKENTKQAILRIMDLNGKEQFIDDVTKLVVASMSLGLKFDNLVE